VGQRLTPEDFNNLFRYFRHEAFRLEAQPMYLVDYEQEPFEDFLRGKLRPATELDYYVPWLEQIREVTASGRRVARVRIVEDPIPTDYQRWEAWIGKYNIAAGEDIRYIARTRARAIGLPDREDWWLFDSERLARMHFDIAGRPIGGQITDEPSVVAQHRTWRDLAVDSSVPTMDCLTA
jgi:hypothetical protein